MRRDVVGPAALGFGVYQVAIALFIAIAPRAFYDSLGPYGVYNRHYLQDVAAFEGALGVGLLLAARRPGWRAPLFVVTALHYGFHAISHGVVVAHAHPKWVGPVEFGGLLAGALLLLALARRAILDERGPP